MYKILVLLGFLLVTFDTQSQENQIDEADYLAAEEAYAEAKAFYQIGEYLESVKSFSKATKLNPNNSDYLFGRAMSYYELKNLDSAKSDIKEAIVLAPNQPDYHLYAGNIYFKSRQYATAIYNYQKAIENQGNEDVYIDVVKAEFNLATCFLLNKSFEKAIASFSKVLEQDDEFGDAYYSRAFAYLKLGEKDLACADFSKALANGVNKAKAKITERCR